MNNTPGSCVYTIVRMRPQPALFVLLSAGTLVVAPAARADASGVDFEAYAAHERNVTRAQAPADIASDDIQGAQATVFRSLMRDEHGGWVFRAGAGFERHSRFPGLNNASLSAGAAYRWQPALGYTEPWYEISARLGLLKYANSGIRDGTTATLGAAMGKHFTDRLYSRAGLEYERRRADREDVFDLVWRRAFVDIGYRIGLESTLFASVSRIWGDQVYSERTSGWSPVYARASAGDVAFGEHYYAYRVDAITTLAEIGMSLPLARSSALEFSANRYRAGADGGLAYGDTLMRIGLRFHY